MRKMSTREVKVMHKDSKKACKVTETTSENKYNANVSMQNLRIFYGYCVISKCKQRI